VAAFARRLPAPLAPARGPSSPCACPGRLRFQALAAGPSPCASASRPWNLTLGRSTSIAPVQGPEARPPPLGPAGRLRSSTKAPERAAAILFHRVYQEAFPGQPQGLAARVSCAGGWGPRRRPESPPTSKLAAENASTAARSFHAIEVEAGRVSAVSLHSTGGRKRRHFKPVRRAREEWLRADAVVAAVSLARASWPANGKTFARKAPFGGLANLRASPIVFPSSCGSTVWVVDHVLVGPARTPKWSGCFDKGLLFGRAGAPQHLSLHRERRSTEARPSPMPICLAAVRRRVENGYFPAMAGCDGQHVSLVMREAPRATFLRKAPRPRGLRPRPLLHRCEGLILARRPGRPRALPATIEGGRTQRPRGPPRAPPRPRPR